MELKPGITAISLLFTGALIASTADAAEVFRWVDENGDVHYSETLPPDFKDEGHDILNSGGLVIDEDLSLTPPPPPTPEEKAADAEGEAPRDQSGLPRPKALYSEAEIKSRMDSFLMLRYDSEQEIIDAMNVEIKQLEYDRRLLATTRTSMNDSFRSHVSQAANQQRAGVAVAEEVSKDINRLQSRLVTNQRLLNDLAERETNIRTEFDKQLIRYRFLQEEWSGETGDS